MLSNVETSYKTQFGPDARDIRDLTILIIGDTEGTGRRTAALLAEHGARIFFAAQNSAALEDTLEEIRQSGGKSAGAVIDLSHPEGVRRCFEEAAGSFGPVQALVNTLAVEHRLSQAGDPQLEKRLENLQNACTQEALMRLQGAARAQIINVGQIKHDPAALGMAAGLRRQARELGIRVTMVEPGDRQRDCTDEVARCVLGSLVQPFGVDAIFLYEQGSQPVL